MATSQEMHRYAAKAKKAAEDGSCRLPWIPGEELLDDSAASAFEAPELSRSFRAAVLAVSSLAALLAVAVGAMKLRQRRLTARGPLLAAEAVADPAGSA